MCKQEVGKDTGVIGHGAADTQLLQSQLLYYTPSSSVNRQVPV